jgi:hypothetical protein
MTVKKGNISIFVIFVLLASSLLWLLTLIFVQKLLRYQSVAIGYYQSYYTAKAWIETALALDKVRGVWFNYAIPQALITNNFDCGDACTLQTTITARASFVQDQYWLAASCTSGIVLNPSEIKTIPLFYDNGTGDIATLFSSPTTYTSLIDRREDITIQSVIFGWSVERVAMGVLTLSWNALVDNGSFLQEYINMLLSTALSNFWQDYHSYYRLTLPGIDLYSPAYQSYLIIANTSETNPLQFCISMGSGLHSNDDALGQEVAFINSIGSFGGYRVGLQAVLDNSIPQYLLQTYSEL